jgi:hypothetical protein
MVDTRLYFGLPGSVQEIWCPFGDVSGTRIRPTSTFQAAGGGTRVQRDRIGTRQYALNYGGLSDDAFRYLEAFDQGHMGSGPFVYLDPSRRNLLTVNQSSGTADSGSADGFVFVGGSGQSFGSSPLNAVGPRSMLWTSTATAPATAQMRMASPSRDWPGWPVIPRPYSFGFWVTGAGADAIVDFTVKIDWVDVSGVLVSTSTSAGYTSSTTRQLMKLENATPPAGAAFMQPYFAATGATISTGTLLYFTGGQLNEGATLDPRWSPGTGILPVAVMGLQDTWASRVPDFHKSPMLILQEVGM